MSNKPALTDTNHDIKDPKCINRKEIPHAYANRKQFKSDTTRVCPVCNPGAFNDAV